MAKTKAKAPTPTPVPTVRATDLTLDAQNANLGTTRGGALLADSLNTCGFGRPILADKHGTIIAGNKTLKTAQAAGGDQLPVQLVPSDGQVLVVVQRTDLDLLTDPKARRLAYLDNRVHELDLQWSSGQIEADFVAGLPLDQAFFPEELAQFVTRAADDLGESIKGTHLPDPSASFPEDAAATDTPATTTTKDPQPRQPSPQTVGGVVLTFETTGQQARWFALLRRLGSRYPTAHTAGARLSACLMEAEAPSA